MEENGYIYVAGFQSEHEPLTIDMVRITVPAQKYAIFTHRGALNQPGHTIADTFAEIYQTWLPHYQLSSMRGIDFELYDERFIGPNNEQSEVDLYIPIE
jgi:predicted transcriptional regulator YdeE